MRNWQSHTRARKYIIISNSSLLQSIYVQEARRLVAKSEEAETKRQQPANDGSTVLQLTERGANNGA